MSIQYIHKYVELWEESRKRFQSQTHVMTETILQGVESNLNITFPAAIKEYYLWIEQPFYFEFKENEHTDINSLYEHFFKEKIIRDKKVFLGEHSPTYFNMNQGENPPVYQDINGVPRILNEHFSDYIYERSVNFIQSMVAMNRRIWQVPYLNNRFKL